MNRNHNMFFFAQKKEQAKNTKQPLIPTTMFYLRSIARRVIARALRFPVIWKRRITRCPEPGTGGEACVNFIDSPRSERHTSERTHDVASDFAERPLW